MHKTDTRNNTTVTLARSHYCGGRQGVVESTPHSDHSAFSEAGRKAYRAVQGVRGDWRWEVGIQVRAPGTNASAPCVSCFAIGASSRGCAARKGTRTTASSRSGGGIEV